MEYSKFIFALTDIVNAINTVSDEQAKLGGKKYAKLRVYSVSLNPFEFFMPGQHLDVSVGHGFFFKTVRFSISLEDIADEAKAKAFLKEVLVKG